MALSYFPTIFIEKFLGRTLLPMPAGVDAVNIDGDYSAILHKIEGIVIKWTHQVWGSEF